MRDDSRHYLSLFLDDTPLMDVRAPVEFTKGAFPNATNLPLINDDERHRIGICYKQHGQQAAIDLGNALVCGEVREQRMQAWQAWWQANPHGYLYCFRGGLRSQTTQAWLRESGVDAPLVQGGYKAMRRFLLESLEQSIAALPWQVLCGRTGCAKTRVIEQLDNSVDLEGLAHHRGSAFGRRPGGQPGQIDFENALSVALLKLRQHTPSAVIVEDESKLIGRCHVPFPLQDKIKQSPRVIIEETLDARVQTTLEDYVIGPRQEYAAVYGEQQAQQRLGDALLDALDRIRRRLGGARHQALRARLEQALAEQQRSGQVDGHRQWILPLLRDYYDPMYDYMLQHRQGTVLFQGNRDDVLAWLRDNRAIEH
ncbi:tRNA 2-selenouridine synthase [Alcanivorax hongdengensis A-11-3]|uniref:tRNA 2-selenouridine synthase n=1 Tax=Alcanivorax hongdengensis A-11-3 TaxID=1177179 RepID=L0WIB2_9GAMM|nr:tRNA 2-selenouridine(34) synthase MnmH [Alcanivorax hongdengensis]EKF75580.1 tRNA 2-selenouridine synthase [Alcanivorax hongdengensis A-11-3]